MKHEKKPNDIPNPESPPAWEVHHPHDKLAFNALKNKAVVQDLICHYLPPIIVENALFEMMHPYQSKKVSPQHREFQADILYLVPLKTGNKVFVFVHIEHQSTPTKDVPLRIWQYLLLILQEYHQNHPNDPLPLVYPTILYTGEKPYCYSTRLVDLFGDHQETMQTWLTDPIQLIDVCRASDETIRQHRLVGLTEFVFKHRFTMAFKEMLAHLFPWIEEGLNSKQMPSNYTIDVLKYMLEVIPDSHPHVFDEAVRNYFSGPRGDEIMTAAQQLRQEGLQQGIQQGIQQGSQQKMREIAKKLLLKGIDDGFVVETTGLALTDIQSLKATLKPTKH